MSYFEGFCYKLFRLSPSVTSHGHPERRGNRYHWAICLLFSRDIYLQWQKYYRSVILAAKRKQEGSHWSKITRAFLRREYCLNSLETLSKPRRRRQRGQGKTKDLIGIKIAQRVRFKTLSISWPSHAKQQREIPTICVVYEPKPRRQIIFNFHLELNASFTSYAEVEVRRRMRR